ncbi:DUF4197 domain-containing protein [Litoribacter ruber]|uniref:DUF4197 domain-containing protein n=1 Tax=Litoribacter ruber TaxID=702568 RepID=A0AAP2CIE6_9BACT|nr:MULTISPECIES: DUF4197 domain-containing protein [Litoribacter]MBS9524229.1 DUF4197 domain-containing protein [Litoribacter alkaliphilus]MBT0809973.1 DUF4197 domain-containing protein [Litoribacter ruber]
MKNYLSKVSVFLMTLLLVACAGADVGSILRGAAGGALSEDDVASGLKEALVQGISKGSESASREDGFFKNELIRIALPEEMRRVESTMRSLGLGSEVDRVLLTINRGAENAAREARPIFVNAIRQMSVQDAWGILRGEDDAATSYLRRTTSEELTRLFMPRIQESLDQVGATRHYSDLVRAYNAIPTTSNIDPDLNNYVTERALDGLFTLIAEEEKNIRENPMQRTSSLMRRVFAAQDGQ